jgi:crotonobetainyl-CoA:carnitine CoA-transferase CaiB-like acyl-CoA transferase
MAQMQMLDGIKVLDFTHIVAGPHCTKMMADYGAEIIKIEPLTGDPVRGLPIHRDGRSGCFVQHNIGKKNLCMDFTTPQGKDICYELVKQVDVVVENFAPGVMRRNKLDWETLKEINPNLIMCSVSCFGQSGPLAELPGYDFIGQSYAGVLDMNGEPDRAPVFTDLAFGDVSTGTHAYAAIISALFHKFRGGGGQYIDISLLDVLFSYHEMAVEIYDGSNETLAIKRSGQHHPLLSPLGIYSCGGRHIFIVASREQWHRLARLIGRPDMIDDPRFSDIMARAKNRGPVDSAIQSWLDKFSDFNEVVSLMQEHQIPSAPILTIPEVMNHPHVKSRGTVRTVSDPVFGQLKIPNNPLRFSQFPETPELSAGLLGQCNHEILQEKLGYTDHQITELEKIGVIAEQRI